MNFPKLMWSRQPRITGRPAPEAEFVVGARRKGRPPLGSQATSGAERVRRYRRRLTELGKPFVADNNEKAFVLLRWAPAPVRHWACSKPGSPWLLALTQKEPDQLKLGLRPGRRFYLVLPPHPSRSSPRLPARSGCGCS